MGWLWLCCCCYSGGSEKEGEREKCLGPSLGKGLDGGKEVKRNMVSCESGDGDGPE